VHQFAFSVPKKNFSKAVDRNRIKRQMRDIVRLQKDSLVSTQSFAYFISYTHTKLPDIELLQQSISTLFQKLNSTIT
jgi:ribonuclease P protein component